MPLTIKKSGIHYKVGNTYQNVDMLGETYAPQYGMIFWGDSLTAGAGGGGVTYPSICANLLGKTYRNCGIGGENAGTIAARQGGNNLIIPAGSVNGTYTENQMLDLKGNRVLPLKQGGDTTNPVLINGQSCTLTYTGSAYTISGFSGTLKNQTPALFSGYDKYGDITVIFAGHNGPSSVSERIMYINAMLSRVGKKYVIMGVIDGTESSKSADDAAMLAEYGNHFFPTRKIMVTDGLSVAGITPTGQDNTDISNGTVPSSLRSDHIHLNANGYTALGKILASFIVGLGYATYAS